MIKYEDEFKKQMVNLYNSGKTPSFLEKEYGVNRQNIYIWAKRFNEVGSFNIDETRTNEEKELIALRKRNKELELENDILKQAALIVPREKVEVIHSLKNKYSIRALCKALGCSKSSLYYTRKIKRDNKYLVERIKEIFKKSRNNYGSRKIKVELKKMGITASRRLIRRIMKDNYLISNYTIKQFKVIPKETNHEKTENVLNRDFNSNKAHEILVSDLTYIKVNNKWNYICLIIDLFNREILSYSYGSKKDASLVKEALLKINFNLEKVKLFHSDRGMEYKNGELDEILRVFKINRSLSRAGVPYDNAVSEAMYNVLKVEFANRRFNSLKQLGMELFEYVNWYNNHRIHGSLNYLTPAEYALVSV